MSANPDLQKQIVASLRAYDERHDRRSETIDYRGAKIDIPVVTLSPEILLLNYNNSRVRAQLLDHPKRAEVESEPFSAGAQELVLRLLRSTEEYPRLKEELKAFGQVKPGLISRDGVLINGNTRVAALRELGADGVEVAVLPPDATLKDFIDIEMALQMREFVEQDYTFTNELLMMESYLRDGNTQDQLATRLGWTKNVKKRIEKHLRLLGIINEVRAQANPTIPYSEFDSKKELLSNLDDEYQRLKTSGDLKAAENMKWSRIFGMFMGASKDQVREIDEDFLDDEVKGRLGSDSPAMKLLRQNSKNGVIDSAGQSISGGVNVKGLVKALLADPNSRNSDGGVVPSESSAYVEIQKAIRTGAQAKIQDKIFKDYRLNSAETVAEKRRDLGALDEQFSEIAKLSSFNVDKFSHELGELEKVVASLRLKTNELSEN